MPHDADLYDFFVSYARRDNANGWISGFVEELLAEHRKFSGGRTLVPFFDTTDIRGLDDWRLRIYDGVTKSRLFLAFVSPNYFAREWCRREWRTWIDTEIAKHILSSGAAPVYIIEVPGLDDEKFTEEVIARRVAELCGLPPPHGPFLGASAPVIKQLRRRQLSYVGSFFLEGVDALRRDDLRRVLERLAHDLDDRIEHLRRATASESTVPPYNKRFTGRVDELLTLRKQLDNDRAGVITGIHGVGGIGKTELAFAYAHAFAGVYPGGRFLVPCEGKPSLRDAALHLGDLFRERITDDERKIAETYFAAITACLRERIDRLGPILLVLDNVTDPALLSPQQTDLLTVLGPALHLLATTRLASGLRRAASRVKWLTLGELPEFDALDLLEKHRPFADDDEREAARKIVRRLGGFALAVELVAAWLAAHAEVTCVALLERLGLEDFETLAALAEDQDAELRRHNHERRLEAVLGPTLAALCPAERRAMEYAAQFAPDQVPLPWLQDLVGSDFPEIAAPPQTGHEDPWVTACWNLRKLALVRDAEGNAESDDETRRVVRVHRLVQDLTRRGQGVAHLGFRQQAVERLVKERDAALATTTQWKEARWEIEPMDALAQLWANASHPGAAWLMNQVGHRWHALAEWTRAEPLMRRALAIDEASYGPDHPNVAIRLNNLAQLLQATNRLGEAEPLMRRALAIDEASYGPDHPEVATDLNNLAVLLQATNRLGEAEPLMRRALAIDEASYGPDHPNVAIRLNNLAQLLKATNRLGDAEPLMRRALAIDEASYGPDHPNVAIRLNNLAQLLQATNRLGEAEPLMRRALAILEGSLGPDHPNVASALNNLAQLLQATNRLGEAEPLMCRALAIDEASYGSDHPNVAMVLNNLAQVLKATNRLGEAEPLMRRALAILERSLGSDHPNVASALDNLAQMLQAMNRLEEAEPLARRALAIDEASYGPDHPDVATRLNNLAVLLQATNRLGEAEPLMRRALAIWERSLGSNHPNVTAALSNLAQLLQTTNRLGETEALLRRLLHAKERAGDSESPQFALDLNNYALLLRRLRRFDEAAHFLRRAIEIEDRRLPPDHPKRPHRRNNLGIVLMLAGRDVEATAANAEAWRLKAGSHDLMSGRILLARLALCWLHGANAGLHMGQLRTLLSQPELPCLGGIDAVWSAEDIVEGLRSRLPQERADFLGSLVEVLNDRARLPELDRFPEWATQPAGDLGSTWAEIGSGG